MKRLLLLLTLSCTTAFAADPTLVVPPFTKNPGEPVQGDPLQAKYDAAWTRYEEAIATITAEVTKALDAQFEKAADAGNLELADMWDKKKTAFLGTRTIEWPSDGKAKAEWKRKHSGLPFPEEFATVVTAAQARCDKAVALLKEDYDSMVKEYTKGRNLARAKMLRDELERFVNTPAAPAERPTMVQKKPEVRRAEEPRAKEDVLVEYLCSWKWKHGHFPVRYSFSEDGTFLLLGSSRSGKYQIIRGDQTQIKLMWNGEKLVEWVNVGDRPDKWTMNRRPFIPAESKP